MANNRMAVFSCLESIILAQYSDKSMTYVNVFISLQNADSFVRLSTV